MNTTAEITADPSTGTTTGTRTEPATGTRADTATGTRADTGTGARVEPTTEPGPRAGSRAGTARRHKLVIVVGSVREGRFGPVVGSWVAEQARRHGFFDVGVVDLADVEVPLALPAASPKHAGDGYPRPAGMAALTAALAGADAFVVVTPEYNHSYPASLKAAIDWHFTQWAAKPVAFVSYGGAAGGRHAVLHLENVLTELHAVTIREGLAFPNYFTAWQDGRPLDAGAPAYAKTLLELLAWWAQALRTARETAPFPG